MANQENKDFITQFVVVLSVLVLLVAVLFLVARLLSVVDQGAARGSLESEALNARIQERIRPVGRVATTEAEAEAGDAAPVRRSGADVYQGACAACHDTGAAGAPRKGDEGVWAERLGQGLDILVQHAIEGLGAMPPRGGNPSLSDEEVREAVIHLLAESGQEVDSGASETATDTTAEPEAEAQASAPAAEAESVAGDPDAGRTKFATCVACHGAQGQGQGIFPPLAGNSAESTASTLKRYRAGEQVGPNTALMAPNAANLSDQDIADLGAYIETL